MRLLGRVNDLVSAQGARLAESLAANFADERSRSRVDRHVSRQIVVGVEHLTAFVACERLLLIGGT